MTDGKLPEVMCFNCGVNTVFPKKVGSMDYCLFCWAEETPEFIKWADTYHKEEMENIKIVVAGKGDKKFNRHLLPPDDATNGEN